jgi:hypothetical protein
MRQRPSAAGTQNNRFGAVPVQTSIKAQGRPFESDQAHHISRQHRQRIAAVSCGCMTLAEARIGRLSRPGHRFLSPVGGIPDKVPGLKEPQQILFTFALADIERLIT